MLKRKQRVQTGPRDRLKLRLPGPTPKETRQWIRDILSESGRLDTPENMAERARSLALEFTLYYGALTDQRRNRLIKEFQRTWDATMDWLSAPEDGGGRPPVQPRAVRRRRIRPTRRVRGSGSGRS
jgi:hypothetical protein